MISVSIVTVDPGADGPLQLQHVGGTSTLIGYSTAVTKQRPIGQGPSIGKAALPREAAPLVRLAFPFAVFLSSTCGSS